MRHRALPSLVVLWLSLFLVTPLLLAGGPAGLEPADPAAWNAARAAHLLSRAGFGGTPQEIVRLAALPFDQAVAWIVDYEKQPAGEPLEFDKFNPEDPETVKQIERQAQYLMARMLEAGRQRLRLDLEEALKDGAEKPQAGQAGGAGKEAAIAGLKKGAQRLQAALQGPLTAEQIRERMWQEARRQGVGQVRQSYEYRWLNQLRGWWMARMVEGQRPLEEKMVLFWHGHFATGFQTVRNAPHMRLQNELFRKHATGNFGDLVRGLARDPAMLRYLDGNRNIKRAPNENFARELQELFTLGIGSYTEKDIKEAARAFTGWTYRGAEFVFVRGNHDDGPKTFHGQTGNFGGDDIIRIILEQPACARFIAWKLARFFLCEEPPAELVEGLAASFRESGYQLKPLLRQLFSSKAFYSAPVMGQQVKSPAQLVVGTLRLLGVPAQTAGYTARHMAQMGQTLFDPPNVKGWDGGPSWINTSTLLVRYNFSRDVLLQGAQMARQAKAREDKKSPLPKAGKGAKGAKDAPGDAMPGPGEMPGPEAGKPARRAERSSVQPLELLARIEQLETADAVVDHLVALLLQRELPAERKAALRAALVKEGEKWDPRSPAAQRKLLDLIILITSLPEYQLC